MAEDDDAGVINMDAASKWEELKTRVRRKVFKKRSLAKLSFAIGPDLEIGIRLYNLTQETKKARPTRSGHVARLTYRRAYTCGWTRRATCRSRRSPSGCARTRAPCCSRRR